MRKSERKRKPVPAKVIQDAGKSRQSQKRKASSPVSPPPSSSPERRVQVQFDVAEPGPRLSLGHRLFSRKDEDDLADVTFHVTPGEGRDGQDVKAHMIVLREASATLQKMVHSRFKNISNANDHKALIHVPKQVGLDSFNLFLKFIYTDELSPAPVSQSNETLLDLLKLTDHFGTSGLWGICSTTLIPRIRPNNCALMFEHTLALRKNSVCDTAFQTLLTSLDKLLIKEEFLEWDWITWRCLLILGDKMSQLFTALKKWKDHDTHGREEVFSRLVKCVRFRQFGGAEAVVNTLEGTGILTPVEMIDLFVHFAGGKKVIEIEEDDDLQSALDTATPGSRIHLGQGVFEGTFSITKNRIKLIGHGNNSVIKGRIIIDGKECEIAELKIIPANSPEPQDFLALTSTSSGSANTNALVLIKGDGNSFINSSILPDHEDEVNISLCAILCIGNDNKVTGILTHVPSIRICGDKNSVELVTGINILHGISVEGDHNTISDVVFFPGKVPESHTKDHLKHAHLFSAVNIYEGKGNVVLNLRYVQHQPTAKGDEGEVPVACMLRLGSATAQTRIRNCSSGPVSLHGESNELVNTVVSPVHSFIVEGKKHQLIKCESEQFQNQGHNVTTTDCNLY